MHEMSADGAQRLRVSLKQGSKGCAIATSHAITFALLSLTVGFLSSPADAHGMATGFGFRIHPVAKPVRLVTRSVCPAPSDTRQSFAALGVCRRLQPLSRCRLVLRQEADSEDSVVNKEGDDPGEPAEQNCDTGDERATKVLSQLGRKTIGVDHGRKRTGVCVSVGYAPRPLPLICHDDNSTDVALQVAQIAAREGAEQIVVGFPLNSTSGEGEQAKYTRDFVSALKEACSTCAIMLWDERFSTAVAREKLQEAGYSRMEMKGLVDTVASIGILSDFFDKKGVGAEVVQDRPSGAAGGGWVAGGGGRQVEAVPSYKERLKLMQAAAAAAGDDMRRAGGKKKRKRAR